VAEVIGAGGGGGLLTWYIGGVVGAIIDGEGSGVLA